IDDQSLDILVDLIQPTAKRPLYWLFASETLIRVPEIARDLETPWYEKYIPKSLMENRIFGMQLFRWIEIPLFVGLGFALVWVVTWLLRVGVEWVLRKVHRENMAITRTGFFGPLRILLLGYLVSATAPSAPTLVARQMWRHVAIAVTIAGVGWLLIRITVLATEIAERRFRRQSSLSKIAPLKLASWGLRAFLAVAALVAILYAMEINPTTVVTGLGLGGVALAFAAQKTIENVFGTVMIVVDQPVRVGDFCKIGEATGTIEEIGLRCTRVRTMNHTVLTVPNGQLAAMVLENFSSRQMIWFRHVIGLRYETAADQLRYVLAQIRDYLQQHPKVESGTSRVRFVKFGASSLDIELFAYILVNDYALFLGVQEEMLIRIMDIIAEAGTGVAFPSQTTYLAKDTGLDAEKTQAVIDEVRKQKSSVPAS
ncbi:MAG TPA: mechanosensitive ion channel family protein, partial [Terriglobia bacterium]|nr:mechanosensitive ion channel family protein [Terriglobia bacterium]